MEKVHYVIISVTADCFTLKALLVNNINIDAVLLKILSTEDKEISILILIPLQV